MVLVRKRQFLAWHLQIKLSILGGPPAALRGGHRGGEEHARLDGQIRQRGEPSEERRSGAC